MDGCNRRKVTANVLFWDIRPKWHFDGCREDVLQFVNIRGHYTNLPEAKTSAQFAALFRSIV